MFAMTSETLQLLNLSPIPELSEMELSSVLEQLSGLSGASDLNTELTDRKVEDILREAEELIDKSANAKYDIVDSKSLKKKDHMNENNNESNSDCNKDLNDEKNIIDHSGSGNDILNLSLPSEENSESLKNDIDNSQTEVSSSHTSRSLTNHIQSTIDSLRECSKKIENKTKNSPTKSNNSANLAMHNTNHMIKKVSSDEGISKESKSSLSSCKSSSSCFKEKTENKRPLNSNFVSTKLDKRVFKKPDLKQSTVFNKNISKKNTKRLNFNESVKTQDCFERLYRSKPCRLKKDNKVLKKAENIEKKAKPCKSNILRKGKEFNFLNEENDSDDINSVLASRKIKSYSSKQFDSELETVKTYSDVNYLIEEDINLAKCLELLNNESESLSNISDVPASYTEFAEKIFNHYSASVNTLQKEVEDLRSQLKRNNNTNDYLSTLDSQMIQKFYSQENLIHALREENSKLFKEIEEIKGQLKMDGVSERKYDLVRGDSPEKEKVVESSKAKVSIQQSVVANHSQKNGILRLEEQFSSLKQKYDKQMAKLENENKKLKETITNISSYVSPTRGYCEKNRENTNIDVALQTEENPDDFLPVEIISAQSRNLNGCNPPKRLIRSVSLENCKNMEKDPSVLSHSCETVRAGTYPMKNSFSQTDIEICNVGIQCENERFHLGLNFVKSESNVKSKDIFREMQKLENKENLTVDNRKIGKTRPNIHLTNQVLFSNKQRKISEHETQLMVTLRALHSEIADKDRENKKMKNELEVLRNQMKKLTGGIIKQKKDNVKKICHIGTQTIGLSPKIQEPYDPVMFQVSKELENENEELKSRLNDMDKIINQLKDKRIYDLQILQKLHEEEIGKLASRLNTQTALTNHLHSLLMSR